MYELHMGHALTFSRLWDLVAGKVRDISTNCTWDITNFLKTQTVLTHHKKSVRSLAIHPTEYTFGSSSTQSIKQWMCPRGDFMLNFSPVNSIVNTLSVNEDNVLFAGSDNGEASFYDWKTGHCFQSSQSIAQPGSLDAEAGVMCSTFDRTGLRLITGESDVSTDARFINEMIANTLPEIYKDMASRRRCHRGDASAGLETDAWAAEVLGHHHCLVMIWRCMHINGV